MRAWIMADVAVHDVAQAGDRAVGEHRVEAAAAGGLGRVHARVGDEPRARHLIRISHGRHSIGCGGSGGMPPQDGGAASGSAAGAPSALIAEDGCCRTTAKAFASNCVVNVSSFDKECGC